MHTFGLGEYLEYKAPHYLIKCEKEKIFNTCGGTGPLSNRMLCLHIVDKIIIV